MGPDLSMVLYPLVLDDRLELILVTADAAPVRRKTVVDKDDLDQSTVSWGFQSAGRRFHRRRVSGTGRELDFGFWLGLV